MFRELCKLTNQKDTFNNERLNWDEYFINLCYEVAKKSKDPSTQVGAIIVYRPGERKPHLAVGKACPLWVGMNRPLKYY